MRHFRFILIVCISLCSVISKAQFKMPKFGKGLNFVSKDTSFKVKFNVRIQNLFIVEYDMGSTDSIIMNRFDANFLVRRARLKFGGYAFSPNIEYKMEFGLSNRDISTNKEDGLGSDASRIILDAVLKWKFGKNKNYAIWVGQTKLPGNRERVISSGSLQLVDRSLVNSRFNIDRDMGIHLKAKWKFGNVVVAPTVVVSQGEGRDITAGNFGGLSYTGHLEFKPFGDFTKKGDFVAADLYREEKPKLAIGLTANYNDRAIRQGGQLGSFVKDTLGNYVENSLTNYMADLMFKYKGLSIHSEFGYRMAAKQLDFISKNFNTGYGFNFQMGYLFKNNFEVAGRFTMVRKDNDYSGINDTNEYTLAFSRYIVGHNLKIQTDIGYSHDPAFISEGVIRYRLQFEIQF